MRIWAAAALLAVPLAFFAYTSTFSRYSGDDYCWTVDAQTTSFLDRQVDVYEGALGRWASNALISGVAYLGPDSARVLPTLGLLVWIGATTWLAYELTKSISMSLLLTELFVLGTIVASPGLARDAIIWQTGLLTYLPPFAITAAGLAAVLRWRSPVIAAAAAFLAGGFVESFTAAMVVALALSTLLVARKSLPVAALAGAAFSGLIIVFSPGNEVRRGDLFSDMGSIPLDTLAWTIRVFLFVLPALVMVLLLAATLGQRPLFTAVRTKWVLITAFLLTYVAILPSVYGLDGLAERTAMLPAAIAVGATLLVGLSYGTRVSESVGRMVFAPALLLLVVSAFLELAPLKTEFSAFARAWDQRDATLQSLEAGASVTVRPIESPLRVWHVREDPLFCMARYYNLGTLEVEAP
jgi:hypothetical protein